jgi:hypothetical protein
MECNHLETFTLSVGRSGLPLTLPMRPPTSRIIAFRLVRLCPNVGGRYEACCSDCSTIPERSAS